MKLYFFALPGESSHRLELIKRIRRRFEQSGIEVFSNLDHPASPEPQSTHGEPSTLNDVDGLLIEGSVQSPDIGYLLAYAIAQKKPTLFLIEKRLQHQSPLIYLSAKETPRNILVGPYTEKTFDREISRFSEFLEGGALPEIPSIKFTFRITPTIERYLRWKSGKLKIPKADFLRNLLSEKIIPEDNEYQRKDTRAKDSNSGN